eukprot:scaffold95463_cov33-Prasinocladus_malaysianus.AAC.1
MQEFGVLKYQHDVEMRKEIPMAKHSNFKTRISPASYGMGSDTSQAHLPEVFNYNTITASTLGRASNFSMFTDYRIHRVRMMTSFIS